MKKWFPGMDDRSYAETSSSANCSTDAIDAEAEPGKGAFAHADIANAAVKTAVSTILMLPSRSAWVSGRRREELQLLREILEPQGGMSQTAGVTALLLAWSQGDQTAMGRLAPLVYAELHRIARRCGRIARE